MTSALAFRTMPLALTVVFVAAGCDASVETVRTGRLPTSLEVAAPKVDAALAPSNARCTLDAPATVGLPATAGAAVGSTVALARHGDVLVAYVADEDAKRIRVVSLADDAEIASTNLGATPSQLLVADDSRVFVALRDESQIAVLAPTGENGALVPLCTRPVAAEPVALAARDGALWVTSRWGQRLTKLDAEMKPVFATALARDPHGVALMGDVAYVSHVVGSKVSMLDARSGKTIATPSLKRREPFGDDGSIERHAGQAYGVVPTEDGLAIALTLTDPGDARVSVDITGYGGGTEAPVTTGLIARFDRGDAQRARYPKGRRGKAADCVLPRAAAYDAERRHLLVACQGSDDVVAFADGADANGHAYRFAVANGPTGVAIADGTAVVWSQFSATLTATALLDRASRAIALTPLGAPDEQVALGRKLFHDASATLISFDGRACASCHPDGRDDALTWATDEGPRQTPILMGRIEGSAPYGWNGDKAELDGHLRRTIRRLGGAGLTARERDALVAYINSLAAPALQPSDEERIERGARLFASAATGCTSCHVDTFGTDRLTHDVGTLAPGDDIREFDTPSLRFVGQSAPYFHDGRYPTLVAMLRDAHMQMGRTAHLSEQDVDALAAYLHTL